MESNMSELELVSKMLVKKENNKYGAIVKELS